MKDNIDGQDEDKNLRFKAQEWKEQAAFWQERYTTLESELKEALDGKEIFNKMTYSQINPT